MNQQLTKRMSALCEIFLMMFIYQMVRVLSVQFFSQIVTNTLFHRKMITMVVFLVFIVALLGYAKLRKQDLSVSPEKISKWYLIATMIVAVFFITTPSNYIYGFAAIMEFIYGCIVTPIFEELLFRGFAWNRLEQTGLREPSIYFLTVVLFTVWHIGYMIPQMMEGNWVAVLSKLAVGLVYGLILGGVRLKLKNCYAAMLLHGLMNLFIV